MGLKNNILALINDKSEAILTSISQRVKERRVESELTQKEFALRTGIPFSTYRRFERTGEISLRNLLMIGVALDMTDEFSTLFSQKIYRNMDDLLKSDGQRRQRVKKSNG